MTPNTANESHSIDYYSVLLLIDLEQFIVNKYTLLNGCKCHERVLSDLHFYHLLCATGRYTCICTCLKHAIFTITTNSIKSQDSFVPCNSHSYVPQCSSQHACVIVFLDLFPCVPSAVVFTIITKSKKPHKDNFVARNSRSYAPQCLCSKCLCYSVIIHVYKPGLTTSWST